jgi:hypothetical protein
MEPGTAVNTIDMNLCLPADTALLSLNGVMNGVLAFEKREKGTDRVHTITPAVVSGPVEISQGRDAHVYRGNLNGGCWGTGSHKIPELVMWNHAHKVLTNCLTE